MATTISLTLRPRHAAAALVTLALGVAGCSSYNNARGKGDAPVGNRDDAPANVVNFPDGFANIATKCSGVAGKRIWVATHGGNARTFTVETDESCR